MDQSDQYKIQWTKLTKEKARERVKRVWVVKYDYTFCKN